jgi:hypothetical protein
VYRSVNLPKLLFCGYQWTWTILVVVYETSNDEDLISCRIARKSADPVSFVPSNAVAGIVIIAALLD